MTFTHIRFTISTVFFIAFAMCLIIFSGVFYAGSSYVHAQEEIVPAPAEQLVGDVSVFPKSKSAVATMVTFSGPTVAYGDIVVFAEDSNIFVLADQTTAQDVFGVVIKDPALLFMFGDDEGRIPVVSEGTVLVNVTLEAGPIARGDPLTAAGVPGKARKAVAGEASFAVAMEGFSGEGGVLVEGPDGTGIMSGTISADMQRGGVGSVASVVGVEKCDSLLCGVLAIIEPQVVMSLSRYALSGVIAAISLLFAFRSFMSDANYGIISIGRNPSAKNSIRSLVYFNAFLALTIAGIGLFTAVAILLIGDSPSIINSASVTP